MKKLVSSVQQVESRVLAIETFNKALIENLKAEMMVCPVKAALCSAMSKVTMLPFEVWAGMVQTVLPELDTLEKLDQYLEKEDYTYMGIRVGEIQLYAFEAELNKLRK